MRNFGINLSSLPVKDLTKIRDLEYYEGSLLAEFRSSQSDTYLFSWVDADEADNRWLVFRVSPRDLAEYTRGLSTLRSILYGCRDGFVYLVDLDSEGSYSRIRLSPIEALPEDYIPAEESYFDPELMPEPERGTRDVLIDGHWELADLGDFPRTYRKVYNMLYTFSPRREPLPNVGPLHHNIREGLGYASENMYNQLGDAVPATARPRLNAVHYASAGVISMSLDGEVADKVAQTVAIFRKNRGEIDFLYRFVWEATHRKGPDGKLQPVTGTDLDERLRRLVVLLGGLDWERLRRSAKDILYLADITLAHYRMLRRLDKYLQSGKVQAL